MKGHDRRLSPACSAPPCLHPLEQTRYLTSLVHGRSVTSGKALSDLRVEAYPFLGNIYFLIPGFLLEVFYLLFTTYLG